MKARVNTLGGPIGLRRSPFLGKAQGCTPFPDFPSDFKGPSRKASQKGVPHGMYPIWCDLH